MRFLKDSECNNGANHSTDDAGDCRAKVPIHIPSKFGWNSISWIILACICGFLFIVLEDKFQRSIFFAIIIGMAVLISQTDILWRFHRRLFIRVISTVCDGIHPSHFLPTIIFIVNITIFIILITIITISS